VVALTVDTGDDDSVRAMVRGAIERLGGVDILVNAAAMAGGAAPPPKIGELTSDLFWEDVNVKVVGYLRCIREVAPLMIANGWGRIVNISGLAARSTGSLVGSIRNVAVAAATKNLADELGRHGINVTVVHPGLTLTEGVTERLEAEAERRGKTLADVLAERAAAFSSNRVVDPSEIAYVVAFLASPKSVAMNGDAVVVAGGTRGTIHY
jgi:NAD(P)-dependent dehydrogenase (short-subunit alcohol dehydrogenase family)